MRVLIINLTRLGDLIQTIGLVNKIKEKYPEVLIDILVIKAFSPIVKHISYINEIICLDDGVLVAKDLSENFVDGYLELHHTINRLNAAKYDILYNPIVSKQSALLAFLINAKRKLGMEMTENREQKMTCDFIAYQLANQHKIGDFSFNLVDIISGMAMCFGEEFSFKTRLKLNVYKEDESNLSDFLSAIKSTNKKIIGIHIGASQSNKAWEKHCYHKVINHLLGEKDFCIILFGGYNEKEFKSFFFDIKSELFFNTIGNFKLNELVVAISSIDLMVTNDTGPMHIAVATGKPVIDISLGPVSKWETGPYHEDSIIIQSRMECYPCGFYHECSHWSCHHAVSPEDVVKIIRCYFEDNNLPLGLKYQKLASEIDKERKRIRMYITKHDQFGFHFVRPILREEITEVEYIFSLKRFIWSLYFFDKLHTHEKQYREFIDTLNADYIIPELDFIELKELLSEMIEITTKILANLKLYGLNKNNLDKNKKYFQAVTKYKEVLYNKARESELIYDWFEFVLFKESEIDDRELYMIIQKTRHLYEILKMKLVLFKELLP